MSQRPYRQLAGAVVLAAVLANGSYDTWEELRAAASTVLDLAEKREKADAVVREMTYTLTFPAARTIDLSGTS